MKFFMITKVDPKDAEELYGDSQMTHLLTIGSQRDMADDERLEPFKELESVGVALGMGDFGEREMQESTFPLYKGEAEKLEPVLVGKGWQHGDWPTEE